jgi:23S rRNA (cytidine1920-2'-O)/16S rRNA (cytidine1409-2'-O)-methyltransferase
MTPAEGGFVSRGGEKLLAALDAFRISVGGCLCADFGANVGGFTDCLLQRGARQVFAVDTGYGALDWRLRNDPRVVVMERTNALYVEPPAQVDLVVIDVAFTPQRLIVPAAARWLKAGGQVVSLLKPHYELAKLPGAGPGAAARGRLDFARAADVCRRVCQELAEIGLPPLAVMPSPLTGKGGNLEFFLHLRPLQAHRPTPTNSQFLDANGPGA